MSHPGDGRRRRALTSDVLLRARILAVRLGHLVGSRRPVRRQVLIATAHTEAEIEQTVSTAARVLRTLK